MIVHGQYVDESFSEKLHYHTLSNEYFYVVKGNMQFLIDDKIINIKKNECLETSALEKHKILSIDKNTEYIVVRVNNPDDQKIVLE